MKTLTLVLAILLLGAAAIVSLAAEKIDLTTPYSPVAPVADFEIHSLLLDWHGQGLVIVVGKGDVRREIAYNGDEALVMIRALNKANLTTKSLQRRIFEQLVKDKKLEGVISGTPD